MPENLEAIKPFSSQLKPDKTIDVKKVFGFDCKIDIKGFSTSSEYVPKIDEDYCFEKQTTLAILAGFSFNINLT